MRVLFRQISTSCSKPTAKPSEVRRAASAAWASVMPGSFLTIAPYMSTKLFPSIG